MSQSEAPSRTGMAAQVDALERALHALWDEKIRLQHRLAELVHTRELFDCDSQADAFVHAFYNVPNSRLDAECQHFWKYVEIVR